MDADEYRLIGISNSLQLVRDTRLLENRTFLHSNQNRFLIILLAELTLALNLIIGDYYIFHSMQLINYLLQLRIGLSERLVRAIMDNGSHFTVAMLTWLILSSPVINLKEILLTGLMASLIDLDHFLAARSMSLQHAIELPKRPFLHNSLTLFVVNLMVYAILVYFGSNYSFARKVSLMFFVAWITHHVRDANRRGLWFGALFTTPPIRNSFYVGILLILPLLLRYDYSSSLSRVFKSFYSFNYNKFVSDV